MCNLWPRKKGDTCLLKLLDGLSYKKIWRYNNSTPCVMSRWPPQQIPPLNFLEVNPPFPTNTQLMRLMKNALSQTDRVKAIKISLTCLICATYLLGLPSSPGGTTTTLTVIDVLSRSIISSWVCVHTAISQI